MRRLATVTYNYHCNYTNYGSALQTWALLRVLNSLAPGEVEAINLDYCPASHLDKDPLDPMRNTWDTDPESLRMLEGLVQVYLPDMKYALSGPAARYSAAADYPQVARAAILEMYRQTGPFRLDGDGMLQRGVLIRHLILPQQGENTRRVIDWVGQTFAPGQVLFSLMSQYTPVGDLAQWPELQQPVSPALNDAMYEYLMDSPITDGFYQDLDAATGDMIPAFDGTGVSAANPSIQ